MRSVPLYVIIIIVGSLKRENYCFLSADCDECVQNINVILIKYAMLMRCANNVKERRLCGRSMQQKRNGSRNFADVVDEVNITIAQSL